MKKKPQESRSRTPPRTPGHKAAEPSPDMHTQPSAQAARVQDEHRSLADPVQVRHLARFFKTGSGDYGEGDRFRELLAS